LKRTQFKDVIIGYKEIEVFEEMELGRTLKHDPNTSLEIKEAHPSLHTFAAGHSGTLRNASETTPVRRFSKGSQTRYFRNMPERARIFSI
jgi:hypothetical protein